MATPSILSNNTPITTALAFAICGIAFFSGMRIEHLGMRIDNVGHRQVQNERDTKEWRTKTTEILDELKQLTRDNKFRIDRLDDTQTK